MQVSPVQRSLGKVLDYPVIRHDQLRNLVFLVLDVDFHRARLSAIAGCCTFTISWIRSANLSDPQRHGNSEYLAVHSE